MASEDGGPLGHVAANEMLSLPSGWRTIFFEIIMLHWKHESKRGEGRAHHNPISHVHGNSTGQFPVGANGSLHISHGESVVNSPMARLPWSDGT